MPILRVYVQASNSALGSLSSNDGNENENITWQMMIIFVITASSSHPLLLTEHHANGLVEVNIENERFNVAC